MEQSSESAGCLEAITSHPNHRDKLVTWCHAFQTSGTLLHSCVPLPDYNCTSNLVISLWPVDRAASLTYSLFAPNLKFRNSLVGLGQVQDGVLTVSIASHCQPVDSCPQGPTLLGEDSVSQGISCQVSQTEEDIRDYL